jgi:hypothetical protein
MAVQQEQHEFWISPEEYLEIDRASLDVKYEYVDGQMYAMSGGTIDHAQIAMNLIRALGDHFQGKSCRVFSSDVHVQVADRKYFYPDVTVSCNPEDWQQGNFDIIRVDLILPTTGPTVGVEQLHHITYLGLTRHRIGINIEIGDELMESFENFLSANKGEFITSTRFLLQSRFDRFFHPWQVEAKGSALIGNSMLKPELAIHSLNEAASNEEP